MVIRATMGMAVLVLAAAGEAAAQNAILASVEQAEQLAKQTGRPILAIAGSKN